MHTTKTRIAVTGATGFIGRSVVRQLKDRSFSISALCRNPIEDPAVNYVKGDLNSKEALDNIANGADTFIHIAGLTKARTLKDLLDVNETGAANAVKAARKAGVRRFLLVSSIAAREPHLSPYAQSKRAGEDVVQQEIGDLELVIVRPPAIIGPGDDATAPMLNILQRGFLPAPAGKALKEGRMSFVYMDDIARFLIEQINAPISKTIVTPCGATPETGWHDLAETAAKVLSKSVKVLPLPYILLMSAAVLNQTISALFFKSGFFNAGKVRELLHTDWTGKNQIANAYTLDEALRLAFGMDIDV